MAALKIKGEKAKINFDASKYKEYFELLDTLTLTELVKTVKSRVPPPVRITSGFRGVTHSAKDGAWEARYQTQDKKAVVSLGFFAEEVDAAREFDRAMVRQHGTKATVNFQHADYQEELLAFHQREIEKLSSSSSGGAGSGSVHD